MNSVRGRLIGVFLLVSLLALGSFGYVTLHRTEALLTEGAQREGMALAEGASAKTDALIGRLLALLEFQAQRPEVLGMDWTVQRDALAAGSKGAGFLDVFVLDPAGKGRSISGKEGDYSDRGYFKEVLSTRRSYVADPVISKSTGESVVVFAVPIVEGPELRGILMATMRTKDLAAFAASMRWAKTGYAFIVDRKGLIAAHPNAELVGKLNLAEAGEKVPPQLAEAVRSALGGVRRLGSTPSMGRIPWGPLCPFGAPGGV
ncbi:cache domain-containing protein [Thermanaerovibrio acidaminovorans]|uniref:cache domain-containing protein n=1 Tax=Thermanaerovibrio acidaminovorans TaxID=81462 RepID=UPI0024910D59|nr:cache domain-containing protein [Thermanaerovibrio acidaminovorans]